MSERSLLFVPGNRPDRFEKACLTEADFVCIDLEDAVAPDEKAKAQAETIAWLRQTAYKNVGLRVNATDNEFGEADIDALSRSGLTLPFTMIPKVSSGAQVARISDRLPEDLGALFVVVESAKGVRAADDIYALPRVEYSIFGAIDYSADIGSNMEWETMLYARSHLVASARAFDVSLFDTPFTDVRDTEGCEAATRRAKQIGIFARSAIHPAQIPAIHTALRPNPEEIKYAQRVLAAIEASKGNVALLDGKLLEEPVVKKARRVLSNSL